MIRFILFLALVTGAAVGVSWLLERPGEVVLVWQGNRYETSLMVMLSAVAAVSVAFIAVWGVLKAVFGIPAGIAHFVQGRRRRRGMQSVARGLVALGVGDAKGARRASNEAGRLLGHEPLTLLLAAQTAQLQGDQALSRETFNAMLEQPDTRPLGLRGLYLDARKQGRIADALRHAEAAARLTPDAPWAGEALLELHTSLHDWDAALKALARHQSNGLIDRAKAKRLKAVILVAKAMRLAANDAESARTAVLEAVKRAPDLVPAAALAAKLLAEHGETRRASRIALAAWDNHPHPDLAEVYVRIRSGDSAQERLKRARTLAGRVPLHKEGAVAVAMAALEARDFVLTRQALEPFTRNPTRRICVLMADIEERETGDLGRARQWLARAVRSPADEAWIADGVMSEEWLPASPVTGQLDAFEWRQPAGQIQALESLGALQPAQMVTVPEPSTAPVAAPVAGNGLENTPSLPPPAAEADPPPKPLPRPPVQVMPAAVIPDNPGPGDWDDGTPRPKPVS
jgi:HemY protein